MHRLRIQRVRSGEIPSERIVDLKAADGTEEQVIVDSTQVQDDYLFVSEVQSDADRVLVELPREAMSGTWRMWVARNRLKSAS
jgi:hypothetical protein